MDHLTPFSAHFARVVFLLYTEKNNGNMCDIMVDDLTAWAGEVKDFMYKLQLSYSVQRQVFQLFPFCVRQYLFI